MLMPRHSSSCFSVLGPMVTEPLATMKKGSWGMASPLLISVLPLMLRSWTPSGSSSTLPQLRVKGSLFSTALPVSLVSTVAQLMTMLS